MKKISAVLLLLFTLQMTAQYGNTESRPYYPNPKKGEKIDPIESSVNYLKKELNLDNFQAAAIKNSISDNQKEVEKIRELPILHEEKVEKVKILREKLDSQIRNLLSESQIKKFELIKEKKEGKKKKDEKE
jgi:hypothetical protein